MGRVCMWLLVLAACEAGSDPGDYPIVPGGGGGGGGGGRIDAAVDADGDGGLELTGRVCLVVDLRLLAACAPTGAGGLTVTVGAQTAITLDSGAFTIATPSGSSLVWRVTGSDIVPSVMAFGSSTTIPAIGAEDYLDLLGANGVVLQAAQGAVILRVVDGDGPVTGAQASAVPVPQYAPFYDGNSAEQWNQNATGDNGIVWLPGAAVGTVTVTVTPPVGAAVVEPVGVEDQAITFATLEFP